LTQRLLAAGYRVVGIEPCNEMLDRAQHRLGRFNGALRLIHSDAQSMQAGGRFHLAVATYGMVAHLLTDEERLAVFRNVYRHLEPGGVFIFDDMPGWLAGASDGSRLDIERTVTDPETGMRVRLMTNMIDVADQPLSIRYDFIDWLDSTGKIAKRVVVRVLFRNIGLEEELRLLRAAGFGDVELVGGFDGRQFSREDTAANTRLILRCRRLDG
jgi:SAM-dependent methyltransferase